MMRWVRIENVGDTEFLIDEQTDKFRFIEENERVIQAGGRPATGLFLNDTWRHRGTEGRHCDAALRGDEERWSYGCISVPKFDRPHRKSGCLRRVVQWFGYAERSWPWHSPPR